MATTPTQNSVPSEKPQDLKFNAGKIDEFVTSLANIYLDRFGGEHYTIEGLRWLAQQAIAQYGWILIDSFQDGAAITLPNQALRDEDSGEYYRWDGGLPKSVPAGSTPATAGGVGVGAWMSIGDAALRTMLATSNGASAIGTQNGNTVQQELTILRKRERTFEDFGAAGDGVADDTTAMQAALDWLATVDYARLTVGNMGAKYRITASLVMKFDNRFQDINSTKYIDFIGSCIVADANGITCLKMCHNYIKVSNPVVINPNNRTNVTAYAFEPENTSQTTTRVTQMHCGLYNPSADGVFKGLRFGCGPTVSGSDSGAFWFTIFDPHFNNVNVGFHFAPASTGTCNITRITIYNPRHTNGNVTWLMENANTLNVFGGSSENITFTTGPRTKPAVFVATKPSGQSVSPASECSFYGYYTEVATYLYDFANDGSIENVRFIGCNSAYVTNRPDAIPYNRTFWTNMYGPVVSTTTAVGGYMFSGCSAGDGTGAQAGIQFRNDSTATAVLASDRSWEIFGSVKNLSSSSDIKPTSDALYSLGSSSLRWNTVYASTGTINTSDERLKLGIAPDEKTALSENNAAEEIRKCIYRFKFTDAINSKGNCARIHFGVGAQTVGEIMRKNGLTPEDYAFWCHDEWSAVDDVLNSVGDVLIEGYDAGDRYGIRYDELMMFILKYI